MRRTADGVDHLGSVLRGGGGHLVARVDIAREHAIQELLVGIRVHLCVGNMRRKGIQRSLRFVRGRVISVVVVVTPITQSGTVAFLHDRLFIFEE